MNSDLVDALDAVLPQTQCTRCGYPDCREYAVAMVTGAASINQCPPGGQAGIERLSRILGVRALPLNPEHGEEGPPTTAVIDETRCIGCTLCIQACPVDAIIGSARRMHTVLTRHCTGCDLCLPPCPVDCIEMVELQQLASRGNQHAEQVLATSAEDLAKASRHRYGDHQSRLARVRDQRQRRLSRNSKAGAANAGQHRDNVGALKKKNTIAAAMRRARARRGIDA